MTPDMQVQCCDPARLSLRNGWSIGAVNERMRYMPQELYNPRFPIAVAQSRRDKRGCSRPNTVQ